MSSQESNPISLLATSYVLCIQTVFHHPFSMANSDCVGHKCRSPPTMSSFQDLFFSKYWMFNPSAISRRQPTWLYSPYVKALCSLPWRKTALDLTPKACSSSQLSLHEPGFYALWCHLPASSGESGPSVTGSSWIQRSKMPVRMNNTFYKPLAFFFFCSILPQLLVPGC